jgi:hypothetical protein
MNTRRDQLRSVREISGHVNGTEGKRITVREIYENKKKDKTHSPFGCRESSPDFPHHTVLKGSGLRAGVRHAPRPSYALTVVAGYLGEFLGVSPRSA